MQIFKNKKQLLLLFTLVVFTLTAQQKQDKKLFRIVSYNVENYFDTDDNPEKRDEEYLPGGGRGWSKRKYYKKQANISKVIAAIGGWTPPAIVGLLEVESRKAVRGLVKYSPLKNLKYRYIHYESPDRRGIDVVLLYQPYQFKPFYKKPIEVIFPDTTLKTRDLLHVAGTIPNKDTLHVFLCHFPSRWGGQLESEPKRIFVANLLKKQVDSIMKVQKNPNIVIMGDFNDTPTNKSIKKVLNARKPRKKIKPNKLYNLATQFEEKGKGTHKYKGEWSIIDQFIVSGNMLNPKNSVSLKESDMHIFSPEYLLEKDRTYIGVKPFRTYIGMRYNRGYSDHLPIYLDLWY